MQLAIRRIVQQPQECEPACLAMALEYLGAHSPMDELIRETASACKFTDWEYLHGTAARRRGFFAYVFTEDPWLYDPSWRSVERETWRERFHRRAEWVDAEVRAGRGDHYPWFFASAHRAAAAFLRAGGEVVLRPPSLELIAALLEAQAPVIVPLWGSLFYRERYAAGTVDDIRGMPFGHAVLIAGWEGSRRCPDRLWVVDPSPHPKRQDGCSWENARDILLANLQWTATILAVSREPLTHTLWTEAVTRS
jgi:hypothetical protein